MYLDLTEHRDRFAAYQTDMTSTAAWVNNIGQYYERAFGLQEQELAARIKSAASTSQNARASLKAQIKAEAARLKLARDEMERIGIPSLQLKQWQAAKANEIARLGVQLDYLNAYAQYQSNPDMYWLARSFKSGFENMGNNPWQQDPSMNAMRTAQTDQGPPQPQSLQTLMADLTGGSGAAGAQVDQQNAQNANAGTNQFNPGGANPAAGGAASATDTIAQLTSASPPSPFHGLSPDDQAVLSNIQRIYSQPGGLAALPLETIENMDPAQRGIMLGGGARLGYYNPTELAKYSNTRWQEGNALAA